MRTPNVRKHILRVRATCEQSAKDFCKKNLRSLKQNPKTRLMRTGQDNLLTSTIKKTMTLVIVFFILIVGDIDDIKKESQI